MAWLALIIALASAGIGLWSAWIARRALGVSREATDISREATDISREAVDISREAVEIEKGRRHQELAPRLRAEWSREPFREVVWFHNEGPRSYDEVVLRIRCDPHPYGPRNPEHDGPVWFIETEEKGAELSYRLGELPLHERRGAEVIRMGWPSAAGTPLIFQVTCRAEGGEWTVDMPCEVPGWDPELMKIYEKKYKYGIYGLIP